MEVKYEVHKDVNRVACTLSGDDVEYAAINQVRCACMQLTREVRPDRLPSFLRLRREYTATAPVKDGDLAWAKRVARARAKVKVSAAVVRALRRYARHLTRFGDKVQFLSVVADATADRDADYLQSILK